MAHHSRLFQKLLRVYSRTERPSGNTSRTAACSRGRRWVVDLDPEKFFGFIAEPVPPTPVRILNRQWEVGGGDPPASYPIGGNENGK